jgi:FixJ family two-component response regulator
MINTPPLIAVLDDEPMFCKALGRLLKTHGFDVVVFGRESDLLSDCLSRPPDCLLLDLHMPVANGFQVLERLNALQIQVPVIVITGHDQPGNAERLRALGAVDYLFKPLNESMLLAALGKVIELN